MQSHQTATQKGNSVYSAFVPNKNSRSLGVEFTKASQIHYKHYMTYLNILYKVSASEYYNE